MKPFRPVSSVQASFDFFLQKVLLYSKVWMIFLTSFLLFSFLAQESVYKKYVNNFYYAKEAICNVKTLLP